MALPIMQSTDMSLSMMQTRWASVLNQIIDNPANKSVLLTGIALKAGVNVINHRLGRMMQGWVIADKDSGANIYRSAPMNELTLTLTTDIASNVILEVF